MRQLLRVTFRGAVKGGKKALLTEVPMEWLEPFVLLDSKVQSPPWGTKASWWWRWLHSSVPSVIFDVAFFELLSRQKSPRGVSPGGLRPAYGFVGKDGGKGGAKNQGFQCIDDKLGKPAGEVPLQRMVRTADGRELLQSQLIEERKAQVNEPSSSVL